MTTLQTPSILNTGSPHALRDMLYIAESAIPSRYANSIQIMKMASAFATTGVDVELVVSRQVQKLVTQPSAYHNVHHYYGVDRNFRIRFLLNPVPLWPGTLAQRRTRYFRERAQAYALQRRPDLVYTRSLSLAADLARHGQPIAVECHEYEFFRDNGELDKLLEAAKLPSLRLIVVISENLKRLYADYGLPEAKMLIAHDGVDEALLMTESDQRQLRRATLGVPADAPLVCYTGKLSADRGLHLIFEGAAALPNVYFVLIGGTDRQVTSWQQWLSAHSLANVSFLPFVPPRDVPHYLAAADVLVAPYTTQIPTLSAASPLKLFEYMAAGKPIVISDLPTVREVVTDGIEAILVEPDSAAALIEGLQRALAPEARWLGANAARLVRQYTWQARAECIVAVLAA